MSDDALQTVEAEALVQTKDLKASGRHRAHAALPVTRLCGPLPVASDNSDIFVYSLLKRPRPNAPVVKVDWPASDFYPEEV